MAHPFFFLLLCQLTGGRPAPRFNIETVLAAIAHASSCADLNCTADHCAKMKRVIMHVKACPKGGQGAGCPVCKQFVHVSWQHARNCQARACPVPFCAQMQLRLSQRNRNAMKQRRKMMLLQGGGQMPVMAAMAGGAAAGAVGLPMAAVSAAAAAAASVPLAGQKAPIAGLGSGPLDQTALIRQQQLMQLQLLRQQQLAAATLAAQAQVCLASPPPPLPLLPATFPAAARTQSQTHPTPYYPHREERALPTRQLRRRGCSNNSFCSKCRPSRYGEG